MSLRGTKRGEGWSKSQKFASYVFERDAFRHNFSIAGGGDRNWEIILKEQPICLRATPGMQIH
jgi:hypothetical protein